MGLISFPIQPMNRYCAILSYLAANLLIYRKSWHIVMLYIYTKLLTIIKTVLPKRKKIHMGPCRLPVAKCVWNLKKNDYNLLTFVILNICNTCYVIVLAAKLWGWFSESMTKRIKHSSARKCISLAKQFGRQIFYITTTLFFIFYLLHYY